MKIPMIDMILRRARAPGDSQKGYRVRVLPDTGSTVPLLGKSWEEALQVPLIQQLVPKPIENFAARRPRALANTTPPLDL